MMLEHVICSFWLFYVENDMIITTSSDGYTEI